MLVKDIMRREVISIKCGQTLLDAIECFDEYRIYTLPVLSDTGKLKGLIMKSHLLNIIKNGITLGTPVENIMLLDVVKVTANMSIRTIGDLIRSENIGRFPVVDKGNKLIGLVTKTDVLARLAEETEKILQETEIILNSADSGVVAIDNNKNIRVLNKSAKSMFNLNVKKSYTGLNIIPNIDFEPLLEVMETGIPINSYKCRINEIPIVAHITPVISSDKIMGAVSVLQDMTKLENIAEELEEVKNLKNILQTLAENPYEAAIVIDDKGVIQLINNTYCDFLEVEKEEVIGKKIEDIIPETKMYEVLETGNPQLAELWQVRGKEVVVMRVPIINKNGEIVGAIGKSLFADISLAKDFASRTNKIKTELAYYKEELEKERQSKYNFDHIVGKSEKIKWLKRKAQRAAQTNSTVLIMGESGTGKELLAHAIHQSSCRKNAPFIKINCAGIPENLLESELFGYDEGAFTGARRGGKPGKFQLADKGTIFLDEIGDMPLTMQAKLLRVLQEREVEPVGSNETIKIDVRVIAATNKNLEELVQQGEFREDLYYRLNVVNLITPPLRHRKEDIPLLCEYIINKLNSQLLRNVKNISDQAMEKIIRYPWPGNIRELQNIIERAINLTDDDSLHEEHFPSLKKEGEKNNSEDESRGIVKEQKLKTLSQALEDAEKKAIMKALEYTNNNKNEAAKLLNIHRSMLYRKLNKFNLLD
ncbi:PAS domain S-box-containing protein [Desulfitispora alkaliphila]|uniref:sigma 54-interacting transcriptional regulator n=1 Tax=Desulfitispora alkaliphila TaxID=622674 RepID=UPI003D258F88